MANQTKKPIFTASPSPPSILSPSVPEFCPPPLTSPPCTRRVAFLADTGRLDSVHTARVSIRDICSDSQTYQVNQVNISPNTGSIVLALINNINIDINTNAYTNSGAAARRAGRHGLVLRPLQRGRLPASLGPIWRLY